MSKKETEVSLGVDQFIQTEMKRYEDPNMAILPCLYKMQEENGGWIGDKDISTLSEKMSIPSSKINEVFHFYTMYNKKSMGKTHVQICGNISCYMRGGRKLLQDMCQKYNVKPGEVTADGAFSFSKVECLGACDGAPVVQVNNKEYYEKLDLEKLETILGKLK